MTTDTYTDTRPDVHTIEELPTLVMNAFNAGIITRDEVEQHIAKYKSYSKLCTGQEHTERYTIRWSNTAAKLERELKRHPSSQDDVNRTITHCLRMKDECIAVEDDDDASEDELALCAICKLNLASQSNNKGE